MLTLILARRLRRRRRLSLAQSIVTAISAALITSTSLTADTLSVARLVDYHMPVVLRNQSVMQAFVGCELFKGDTLIVSRGGSATLLFFDGKIKTFSSPTEIILTTEQKSERSTVGRLTSGLLELIFPQEKAGGMARLAVRGEPSLGPPSLTVPMLSFPPSGTTLMEAPDHLEWFPIVGADSYLVSLYDQIQLVWETKSLSAACLLPESTVHLRGGETYSWVVQANIETAILRSEQATFELIDDKERTQVLTAQSVIDSLGLDARIAMMLRLNLYESHSLMLDEYREIEMILKKGPRDYAALLAKARLFEAMSRFPEAVDCYRQVLQQ